MLESLRALRRLLLVFIFCTPVQPIYAALNCENVYTPSINWVELPDAGSSDLRSDLVRDLHNNPIAQQMVKKYQSSSLKFLNPNFMQKGPQRTLSGWSIQGTFVQAVLTELFPQAQFGQNKAQDSDPTKSNIFLILNENLNDSSNEIGVLEMGLLKALNPGPDVGSQAHLRNIMSLPQDSRITSLYITSLELEKKVSSLEIAHRLFGENLSDIMIVTTKSPVDRNTFIEKWKNSGYPARIVTSADWTSAKYVPGKKYIIMNDTKGKKVAVDAASDFSIISGSGNIYEPLGVGRPTYFEKAPTITNFGNKRKTLAAWNALLRRAFLAQGGHHAYENLEELIENIKLTSQNLPTQKMYKLVDPQIGQSPLDEFLKVIDKAMAPQTKKSWWPL